MNQPELLIDCRCECGEGPLWDDLRKSVSWLDIPRGRLLEYSPGDGNMRILFEGDPIGGYTRQADGTFLFFEEDRIAVWSRDQGRRVLAEGIDPDMERFNDVTADPEGRVYAGTIGKGEGQGGLYRIDLDGRIELLFKGSRIANGMAFSADDRFFFFTCSTSGRIYRFDYDRKSGALSNRSVFHEVAMEEGLPDGLALDSEGCLWSARWDGGSVVRISPEGKPIESIRLPVPRVTSVCFGGEDLKTLFVTTAGGSEAVESGEGGLYRFDAGVAGRLEHRSRIRADRLGRVRS